MLLLVFLVMTDGHFESFFFVYYLNLRLHQFLGFVKFSQLDFVLVFDWAIVTNVVYECFVSL